MGSQYNQIKTIIKKIPLLRCIIRKFFPNPMGDVLGELRKRDVALENLNALEIFGGHGEWSIKFYASWVKDLEIWEYNDKFKEILRDNFPFANVRIVDSYREIKITPKKFNFIAVDNPSQPWDGHCEHFDLFPELFRIMMDEVILVITVIPKITKSAKKRYPLLLNNFHSEGRKKFYKVVHPENIEPQEMLKAYSKIIENNGFLLDWYFLQIRNFLLSYLVLKLRRKQQSV